uniref:Uncharacterized protein n=1 Tax=Geobacter metallireducens TaxID=28232 RepID=A0A831XDR5_GEOME
MMNEPSEITAGDHITWTRYDADYLPADGWTLKYALRGPAAINLVSTPDGDSHIIDIPGSASKDFAPGAYSWAGYYEKSDGTRVTRYTGRIKIAPDLVAATVGYDGRSHAEKVLEAIERVIEGRATRGDQELTFDGKRIVKMTVAELIQLRQQYRNEVQAERRRAAAKAGRRTGRTIKYRM